MDVLDGLVRHQQPVLVLEVIGGVPHSFYYVLHQRQVIRMYPANDPFERHRNIRVKFKDAIKLL